MKGRGHSDNLQSSANPYSGIHREGGRSETASANMIWNDSRQINIIYFGTLESRFSPELVDYR